MWLLHMTSLNSTQLKELSPLNTSSGFLQKRNFSERWGTEMSSRDVHMTFFVHAEHPPSINLVVLPVLGWAFYRHKDSKKDGKLNILRLNSKDVNISLSIDFLL